MRLPVTTLFLRLWLDAEFGQDLFDEVDILVYSSIVIPMVHVLVVRSVGGQDTLADQIVLVAEDVGLLGREIGNFAVILEAVWSALAPDFRARENMPGNSGGHRK